MSGVALMTDCMFRVTGVFGTRGGLRKPEGVISGGSGSRAFGPSCPMHHLENIWCRSSCRTNSTAVWHRRLGRIKAVAPPFVVPRLSE